MEGLGTLVEAGVIEQPDLLGAYGEREITLFGVTGQLGVLAEMCPIDLSNNSVEATNSFVIKAMNEAGETVDSQHAELFKTELEKQGSEAKFTIAQNNPSPTQDSEQIPKLDESLRRQRKDDDINLQRSAGINKVIPTAMTTTLRSTETQKLEESLVHVAFSDGAEVAREDLDALRQEHQVHLHETKDAYHENTGAVTERAMVKASMVVSVPQLHNNRVVPTNRTEYIQPAVTQDQDHKPQESEDIFSISNIDIIDWETELTETEIAEEHAASAEAWEAILLLPTEEMYEEFMGLLRNSIISNCASINPTDVQLNASEAATDQDNDTHDLKVRELVQTLSEKLAELEDDKRNAVMPIIRQMISAVHAIHTLEAKEMSIEQTEEMQSVIELSVTDLLSQLDIAVDQESVTYLVNFLIYKNLFTQNDSQLETLDLSKLGTHEAMYFDAPNISLYQPNLHEFLNKLVGGLALTSTLVSS